MADDLGQPVVPRPRRRCRQQVRQLRSLGLSAAVAAALPGPCSGALSIASGYESFLSNIRRRIVCDEDDVFDEAQQRGRASSCDSMQDGPFCRGLPKLPAAPVPATRHRPFTVDSIVPQHIFGNAVVETGESQTVKQATKTLNSFLEEYYRPKKVERRVKPVEGRLRLDQLPMASRIGSTWLPSGFSAGLPREVFIAWDGAWQAEGVPRATAGGGSSASSAGPRRPPSASAARLNGALGGIRFSRPVVVRNLLVHPPLHASTGQHYLLVRAWKARREVWRSAYAYDAALGGQPRPLCAVGDTLMGRWAGDGRLDVATLLESHGATTTVRWLDDDHTHRTVAWSKLSTTTGVQCISESHSQDPRPSSLWRELARKMKSVEEITFSVPYGSEGWLVGDLAVAAARREISQGLDAEQQPKDDDPSTHVVQVLPGPRASIVEASRAAVLYHADDMLERGLRLKSADPSKDKELGSGPEDQTASTEDGTSAMVNLHPSRSSEGLNQFIRALAEQTVRLPPHVRMEQVVADLESFARAVDPKSAKDNVLKRFGHYEAWFGYHWDWLTRKDALEVAFQHWRSQPATVAEGRGIFREGQRWIGSYFCTQGTTSLSLNVTRVEVDANGEDYIEADLTFIVGSAEVAPAQGIYTVAGRLGRQGRELALDRVPGSWKEQPTNFVMVGLQGVVSRTGRGGSSPARYAGTVPILGCDSFQLRAEAASPTEPPPTVARYWEWQQPLLRLLRTLEDVRRRWRGKLQTLIGEAAKKPKQTVVAINGLGSLGEAVGRQLLEAARKAGVLSFETTAGEQIEITVDTEELR